MAYFKDADEVYDLIGGLFLQILEDEELAAKFKRANVTVQYQHTDPDSQITARMAEPGQVDLGPTELEPDVTLFMEADVAHEFWLGNVSAPSAMARGKIKSKGNIAKVMKLVPLAKPAIPMYKARLEAKGRQDLLR